MSLFGAEFDAAEKALPQELKDILRKQDLLKLDGEDKLDRFFAPIIRFIVHEDGKGEVTVMSKNMLLHLNEFLGRRGFIVDGVGLPINKVTGQGNPKKVTIIKKLVTEFQIIKGKVMGHLGLGKPKTPSYLTLLPSEIPEHEEVVVVEEKQKGTGRTAQIMARLDRLEKMVPGRGEERLLTKGSVDKWILDTESVNHALYNRVKRMIKKHHPEDVWSDDEQMADIQNLIKGQGLRAQKGAKEMIAEAAQKQEAEEEAELEESESEEEESESEEEVKKGKQRRKSTKGEEDEDDEDDDPLYRPPSKKQKK